MQILKSRFASQLQMPFDHEESDKPWSITFSPINPIHFNFHNNSIAISISADKITSGTKSLDGMKIEVDYALQFRGGGWHAVRGERVNVESAIDGKRLGARQQVIRTVTRKRFSKLFPREIRIPDWQFSAGTHGNPMHFDMQVKTLVTQTGWISCSMGHKRPPQTEHFISN